MQCSKFLQSNAPNSIIFIVYSLIVIICIDILILILLNQLTISYLYIKIIISFVARLPRNGGPSPFQAVTIAESSDRTCALSVTLQCMIALRLFTTWNVLHLVVFITFIDSECLTCAILVLQKHAHSGL